MKEISCWNCGGTMKLIGRDTFYFYYECTSCGKEQAELRDDRPRLTLEDL